MSSGELDIKLPKPYKQGEKIVKTFDKLNENGKKILSSFLGYEEIETIFYLYLFKKYKSDCFIYCEDPEFRLLGLNFNIMSRVSKSKKELFDNHIDTVAEAFVDCLHRNYKTLVIPITVYDNKNVNHSNLLIYRKKFNQFEHFEPHGAYYMTVKKDAAKIKKPVQAFVDKVNAILHDKGIKKINYIQSEEVCPAIEGLQALEAESDLKTNELEDIGYCISWNMFFTELCLSNPNIESSKLLEIVFEYFKDKEHISNYLRKVIRGYAIFIDEKVNKYLSAIMGQKMTTAKINKLHEHYVENSEKIQQIQSAIVELLKLETYMIINKDFNLNDELKHIKNELKGNKGDIDLLVKKKVLENYEDFNKFTPVSSNFTTSSKLKSPNSLTRKISNKISNRTSSGDKKMNSNKKNTTKKL
jgi:hypothetical protein